MIRLPCPLLILGVGVIHVVAHFEHIHPSVAVELNIDWLLNLRIAQDEFKIVTILQLDQLQLFGRSEVRSRTGRGRSLLQPLAKHQAASGNKKECGGQGPGTQGAIRHRALLQMFSHQ